MPSLPGLVLLLFKAARISREFYHTDKWIQVRANLILIVLPN